MSYEGQEYFLCGNGHLSVFDSWSSPRDVYSHDLQSALKCEIDQCDKYYVLVYVRDDTNGDGKEPHVKVKTRTKYCKCSKCHNKHIIIRATYTPHPKYPDEWRPV